MHIIFSIKEGVGWYHELKQSRPTIVQKFLMTWGALQG